MGTVRSRSLIPITRETVEWSAMTSPSQTVYTNPSVFFDSTDIIRVTINGSIQAPTAYTITFDAESPAAVTVTLNAAPPAGRTLRVFVAPGVNDDEEFRVGIDNTGLDNPTKLQQSLWRQTRDLARVDRKIEASTGERNPTPAEIRDELQSLGGNNRLDISAIQGAFVPPDGTTNASNLFYYQRFPSVTIAGQVTINRDGQKVDSDGNVDSTIQDTTDTIPATGEGLVITAIQSQATTGPVLVGERNIFFEQWNGRLAATRLSGAFDVEIIRRHSHIVTDGSQRPNIVSDRLDERQEFAGRFSYPLPNFSTFAIVPAQEGVDVGAIQDNVQVEYILRAYNPGTNTRATAVLTNLRFDKASVVYYQFANRIVEPGTFITSAQEGEIAANTAKVGITPAQATAITANTAKVGLTDGSVTQDRLAIRAVGGVNIQERNITSNLIADDAVGLRALGTANTGAQAQVLTRGGGNEIEWTTIPATGATPAQASAIALNTAKVGLTDNSVTTARIANEAVTSAKIAANAVGATELANNSVNAAKLTAGTAAAGQVLTATDSGIDWVTPASGGGGGTPAAGSVDTDQLADNAVTPAKVATDNTGVDGQLLQLSIQGGRETFEYVDAPSGSGSGLTPTQAAEIAANTAKTGITDAQANAITANTAKVGVTAGSIGTTELTDNNVTEAKLNIVNDGVSGDVLTLGSNNTLGWAPTAAPGAGSIGTTQLANNAVTAAKIASNTITAAQIAENAVGNSELQGTSSDLFDTARAVGTDNIRNDAVTGAKIADNSITPEHIDGTPTAGQVYTATSATRASWQTPSAGIPNAGSVGPTQLAAGPATAGQFLSATSPTVVDWVNAPDNANSFLNHPLPSLPTS